MDYPVKISQPLLLKLSKKYEPSALIQMRYKGKDVAFRTDSEGNPVVLFIGDLLESGRIRGERYVRTLARDSKGFLIKDHWDLKGKAD
jgi:hypothetical protein